MLNKLRFTNNVKVREKSNNFLLSKALDEKQHLDNRIKFVTNRYNNLKGLMDHRIKLEKKIKEIKRKQKTINTRIYTIKKRTRYNYQRKTVFPKKNTIKNIPIYNYRPIRNRAIRNKVIYKKILDNQPLTYQIRSGGIFMINNIRKYAFHRPFLYRFSND